MASDPTARTERPLSPHLQVYRLPLTAILSILHRMTGVALMGGTLLLAWWLIAAASGPAAFAAVQWVIGSWLGLLVLFGWSVALFFHLLNGIRHLFWDAGLGFDLKTTQSTSLAVIAGTGGLTVLAWAIGLLALGSRT